MHPQDNQTQSGNKSNRFFHVRRRSWRSQDDLRPMAGYITLLGSVMMAMLGASYFYAGINTSNRTHHIPAIQVPTFYTGLWNLSTFIIPLICSIFLIQKKHPKIAVVGIILQLIAGLIPLAATQILQYEHGYSSILAAFPMLLASASALIFVAISKKQN